MTTHLSALEKQDHFEREVNYRNTVFNYFNDRW